MKPVECACCRKEITEVSDLARSSHSRGDICVGCRALERRHGDMTGRLEVIRLIYR